MGRMGSDWNVAMNIEDAVDGREDTPPAPEAHPLERRIGRLLAIVRLIEWSGSNVRLECPLCHGTKEKGHHAECVIAQVIIAEPGPHDAACPRCLQLTTPDVLSGGRYCQFCQGAA